MGTLSRKTFIQSLQGLGPQLGQKLLHILGQLRFQSDPFARSGMFKPENAGVQGLPLYRITVFFYGP